MDGSADLPLTEKEPEPAPKGAESGGWGGWGFSPFSVLSDLQKAATVAVDEISRNVFLFFFSLDLV